jgi:hypothetical protein
MIPPWTDAGVLPAGVHPALWREVIDRYGWNAHRLSLLLGIRATLDALNVAGSRNLWLDGSFVTNKEIPSDWDGCWSYEHVDLASLDLALRGYTPDQRAIRKSKFLGDIFVAGATEAGSGLPFVDFFQQTRDGSRKGIVLLNPRRSDD